MITIRIVKIQKMIKRIINGNFLASTLIKLLK